MDLLGGKWATAGTLPAGADTGKVRTRGAPIPRLTLAPGPPQARGTLDPPAVLRDGRPDQARGRTPLSNPEGRPRRHSPPSARPDWPRRCARVMARAACALAAGPVAGERG